MKKYLAILLLLLTTTASASTITTINSSDTISGSRSTINTNFSNLNTDKLETSAFGSYFYTFFSATTTDRLTEGATNLYFTNARARSALSALFPLVFNSTTGQFSWSGIATSTNPTKGLLSYWTGSSSLGEVATTSVTCTGTVSCSSFSVIGASPITLTGSASGTGGTWATTTSTHSGRLINYPLNGTDIVTIGDSATTTAEMWFDPNTLVSYIKGSLGIGTTTPGTTLGVNGPAVMTGTTTAPGFTATSSSYYVNTVDVTPLVKTIVPEAPYGKVDWEFSSDTKLASTTINWGLVNIQDRINVNYISLPYVHTVATTTFEIGIYDENGNKLVSQDTNYPSNAAPVVGSRFNLLKATLASTYNLGPGNYWIGVVSNATTTMSVNDSLFAWGGFVDTVEPYPVVQLASQYSGRPLFGTTTAATAGALPSSFNPATINIPVTSTTNGTGIIIRLDN